MSHPPAPPVTLPALQAVLEGLTNCKNNHVYTNTCLIYGNAHHYLREWEELNVSAEVVTKIIKIIRQYEGNLQLKGLGIWLMEMFRQYCQGIDIADILSQKSTVEDLLRIALEHPVHDRCFLILANLIKAKALTYGRICSIVKSISDQLPFPIGYRNFMDFFKFVMSGVEAEPESATRSFELLALIVTKVEAKAEANYFLPKVCGRFMQLLESEKPLSIRVSLVKMLRGLVAASHSHARILLESGVVEKIVQQLEEASLCREKEDVATTTGMGTETTDELKATQSEKKSYKDIGRKTDIARKSVITAMLALDKGEDDDEEDEDEAMEDPVYEERDFESEALDFLSNACYDEVVRAVIAERMTAKCLEQLVRPSTPATLHAAAKLFGILHMRSASTLASAGCSGAGILNSPSATSTSGRPMPIRRQSSRCSASSESSVTSQQHLRECSDFLVRVTSLCVESLRRTILVTKPPTPRRPLSARGKQTCVEAALSDVDGSSAATAATCSPRNVEDLTNQSVDPLMDFFTDLGVPSGLRLGYSFEIIARILKTLTRFGNLQAFEALAKILRVGRTVTLSVFLEDEEFDSEQVHLANVLVTLCGHTEFCWIAQGIKEDEEMLTDSEKVIGSEALVSGPRILSYEMLDPRLTGGGANSVRSSESTVHAFGGKVNSHTGDEIVSVDTNSGGRSSPDPLALSPNRTSVSVSDKSFRNSVSHSPYTRSSMESRDPLHVILEQEAAAKDAGAPGTRSGIDQEEASKLVGAKLFVRYESYLKDMLSDWALEPLEIICRKLLLVYIGISTSGMHGFLEPLVNVSELGEMIMELLTDDRLGLDDFPEMKPICIQVLTCLANQIDPTAIDNSVSRPSSFFGGDTPLLTAFPVIEYAFEQISSPEDSFDEPLMISCLSALSAFSPHTKECRKQCVTNFGKLYDTFFRIDPYSALVLLLRLSLRICDSFGRLDTDGQEALLALTVDGLRSGGNTNANTNRDRESCMLACSVLAEVSAAQPALAHKMFKRREVEDVVYKLLSFLSEGGTEVGANASVRSPSNRFQRIASASEDNALTMLTARAGVALVKDFNPKPWWYLTSWGYHYNVYGQGVTARPLLQPGVLQHLIAVTKRCAIRYRVPVYAYCLEYANALMYACADNLLVQPARYGDGAKGTDKAKAAQSKQFEFQEALKEALVMAILPILPGALSVLVNQANNTKTGSALKSLSAGKTEHGAGITDGEVRFQDDHGIHTETRSLKKKRGIRRVASKLRSSLIHLVQKKPTKEVSKSPSKDEEERYFARGTIAGTTDVQTFLAMEGGGQSGEKKRAFSSPGAVNLGQSALPLPPPSSSAAVGKAAGEGNGAKSAASVSTDADQSTVASGEPLSPTEASSSSHTRRPVPVGGKVEECKEEMDSDAQIEAKTVLPHNAHNKALEFLAEKTIDALFAFICLQETFPMATYQLHEEAFVSTPICACLSYVMCRYTNNEIIQRRGIGIYRAFVENGAELQAVSVHAPSALVIAMKLFPDSPEIHTSFSKICNVLSGAEDRFRMALMQSSVQTGLEIVFRNGHVESSALSAIATRNLVRTEAEVAMMFDGTEIVALLFKLLANNCRGGGDVRLQVEVLRLMSVISGRVDFQEQLASGDAGQTLKTVRAQLHKAVKAAQQGSGSALGQYSTEDVLAVLESSGKYSGEKCVIQ